MGEGLHYEEKIHSLLIRSDVILYGFPFGNSQVDAAETDTSNVTYKYIDISTLTETQKIVLSKGSQTRHLQMIMKTIPLCIKKYFRTNYKYR